MPLSGYTELTPGALRVLGSAGLLVAESLRAASTLYKKNGLTLPETILLSEHTRPAEIEPLYQKVIQNQTALISDAGLPVLADPGSLLIRLCHKRNWPVAIEATGTAATVALALAGLGNGGYRFAGFLPRNSAERRQALRQLSRESVPVVFYETPYRLGRILEDIALTLQEKEMRLFIVTELGAQMHYVDLSVMDLSGKPPLSGRPVIIIYRSGRAERV
ncbi:MAG: hypothetical protein HS115_02800 [Spirochaetales bacterium]|nr:hypothetical protein [Spirochaetales bacterium]